MSYQLTPAVLQDLQKLSRNLPAQSSGKRRYVNKIGQHLLNINPEKKSIGGRAIEPNKIYRVREAILVDHFKNLKQIYSSYGWDGVKEYTDKVNQHAKAAAYREGMPHRRFKIILALIIAAFVVVFWYLLNYGL